MSNVFDFSLFRDAVKQNIKNMMDNNEKLFVVNVDNDEMWNYYLNSYPEGTNNIFRERREYDCSACRYFVKTMGSVVSINNDAIHTIWDIESTGENAYDVVAKEMSKYIKTKPIKDVFIVEDKITSIGTNSNFENTESGVIEWEHFYTPIIKKHRNRNSYNTVESIKSNIRSGKDVFKRTLEEITEDSISTVIDLINDDNLYRGETWKNHLLNLIKYKKEYVKIKKQVQKEMFVWEKSLEAGEVLSRIRNSSIGTLLIDLSDGMDLEKAVKRYDSVTAPSNYKRPKAIITKKQLEDAKKTIVELGYQDSLLRRYARVDDLSINDVIYADRNVSARMSGNVLDDIFGAIENKVTINPKTFKKAKEISIDEFLSIAETSTKIEAFVENKHKDNMVSLITSKNKNAKSLFPWKNGMSWAYTGNIADSMKERVKAAGGKVDGDLRFSICWGDIDKYDNSDLDAHCVEFNGEHIWYSHTTSSTTKGNLDVDIQYPSYDTKDGIAVENITYPSRKYMKDGTYRFYVNQYSFRNSQGFTAEIEFDGNVYKYSYPHPVNGNIDVATVTLKNGVFSIKHHLDANSDIISKEVWGVNTNQFVPVSCICLSPNYWNNETPVGLKHYFFMLKNCVNPEIPNGYFNEFIKNELVKNHKRVFEILGNQCKVENTDDQLSGIGFASSKRNDLIIKVNEKDIYKIKF